MFWMLLMVPCLVIHEWAPAWATDLLGDGRPRGEGRLSLNPRRHLYPIGSVLVPVTTLLPTQGGFCFAYAKLVLLDVDAFERPLRDLSLVAAAGPALNVLAGVSSALAWRFVDRPHMLVRGLGWFAMPNFLIAAFNLLPLPPLNGSKVLAAVLPERTAIGFLEQGVWVTCACAIVVLASPWVLHFDLMEQYFDLAVFPLFRFFGGA